jgi:hypothetical protein
MITSYLDAREFAPEQKTPARSLASTACASPFLPPQPATWTVLSDRSGGRTWWAHFEITRINTAPTILPKKIEENPDVLWTEGFLAIIDRTTIAASQRSSPDL